MKTGACMEGLTGLKEGGEGVMYKQDGSCSHSCSTHVLVVGGKVGVGFQGRGAEGCGPGRMGRGGLRGFKNGGLRVEGEQVIAGPLLRIIRNPSQVLQVSRWWLEGGGGGGGNRGRRGRGGEWKTRVRRGPGRGA